MWTVEIQSKTDEGKILKRVKAKNANDYVEKLDNIEDGLPEDAECWIVILYNDYVVDEFLVE